MTLQYTNDIHRLFLEAVENVCWGHAVFGIKQIREYAPFASKEWLSRKDIVLQTGRVISVRVVVEDGMFFIKEMRLKSQ
jgi:hypothetical protein